MKSPHFSFALTLLLGCSGLIGDTTGSPPLAGTEPVDLPFGVSSGDARRLRASEIDQTLHSLFGESSEPAARLIGDSSSVFNADFVTQVASPALIEGVERLATEVAERAVDTDDKLEALVGCLPQSSMDGCIEPFIDRMGLRILRRPLSSEEHAEYSALFTRVADHELGSVRDGLASMLSAMLQHPQFVYHIEIGTGESAPEGTQRLSNYEIASRMSFFLWGEAPNDMLFEAAAAGRLSNPAERRDVAMRMLTDERAHQRILDFHAAWLGYEIIPHEAAIAAAMRAESDALVSRVVFEEQRSWLDLFRLSETFVPDSLAEFYGLALPGSSEPQWVDVAGTDRGTILAHGSYLSQGSKFGDTSPVQRGLLITTRLRCSVVPDPPPGVMVDVDNPPEGGACKIENYQAHSRGVCAGCHASLDGTGMGLETYDGFGRFRLTEPDRPECSLEADGVLSVSGGAQLPFRGPRELSAALIESGELDSCGVTQLYRFAMGRYEVDREQDALAEWTASFRASDHRLDVLIGDMVASETFVLRSEEGGE